MTIIPATRRLRQGIMSSRPSLAVWTIQVLHGNNVSQKLRVKGKRVIRLLGAKRQVSSGTKGDLKDP